MTASSQQHPAAAGGDHPAVLRTGSSATTELLTRAVATGDELEQRRLRDEAVSASMGLARGIAARYRNRGISDEDLVQVACVGLVKAVRGFDPSRDSDFAAYAVPTIAGEVKRYFRDSGWAVRPPRSMQETRAAVMQASAELTQALGRSPRPNEVAQFLGTDVERVIEALAVGDCYTPLSLDVPAGVEGLETLGDLLGTEDGELARTEARLILAPLVRSLKERDREILELRFFHG